MLPNPKQLACDESLLRSYLDGDLSDTQQAAVEEHIDYCEACRARLRNSAADQDWWSSAERYLCRDEWDGEDSPRCDQSRVGTFANSQQVLQQVKQWLVPSDDPRMIGRFAGYEIVGIVGHGGMGVVLKGFEVSLNRYIAIKVLSPTLATSGSARRRFAREAQAAAAVLHNNVVAIHRVDEWQGIPFLVMPYLSDTPLQKRIDDEGPLPLAAVLRVGEQVASGLAAAHAHGLVHRDVKPANILIGDGVERVTLTDFGLARAADDASLTRTGVIAGTPQFMSPEQARGEAVDQRSDLFSLGSVMYTMCTGRPPFRAETSYGILRRITDTEPRHIREINPDVPDWLCAIITKLMSKQPDDRFESAGKVAELLEDCLAHVQQPATVPLPQSAKQLPVAELAKSSDSAASPKVSTFATARRALWILTAVVFTALLLFAGIIITLKRDGKPDTIVKVDEGSQVTIGADGAVEVELPNPNVHKQESTNEWPEKLRQRWQLLERAHEVGEAGLTDVLKAACDYYQAAADSAESQQQQTAARQELVEQLTKLKSAVERQYKLGEASRADLIAVEAELLAVQAQRGRKGLGSNGELISAAQPWPLIGRWRVQLMRFGGENHIWNGRWKSDDMDAEDWQLHVTASTFTVRSGTNGAVAYMLAIEPLSLFGIADAESPQVVERIRNAFRLHDPNDPDADDEIILGRFEITDDSLRLCFTNKLKDGKPPAVLMSDHVVYLECRRIGTGGKTEEGIPGTLDLGRADKAVRLLEIDLAAAQLQLAAATERLMDVEGTDGAIPKSKLRDLRLGAEQAKLDVKRIEVLLDAARKEAEVSKTTDPGGDHREEKVPGAVDQSHSADATGFELPKEMVNPLTVAPFEKKGAIVPAKSGDIVQLFDQHLKRKPSAEELFASFEAVIKALINHPNLGDRQRLENWIGAAKRDNKTPFDEFVEELLGEPTAYPLGKIGQPQTPVDNQILQLALDFGGSLTVKGIERAYERALLRRPTNEEIVATFEWIINNLLTAEKPHQRTGKGLFGGRSDRWLDKRWDRSFEKVVDDLNAFFYRNSVIGRVDFDAQGDQPGNDKKNAKPSWTMDDYYNWAKEFKAGEEEVSGAVDGAPTNGREPRTLRIQDAALSLIHDKLVRGVSFSPDGKRIASSGNDGVVRIWDATNGKQVFAPKAYRIAIATVVRFSRDGKWFASGAGTTVTIWNATSGKQFRSVRIANQSNIRDIAFSADGKRIASVGVHDEDINVWDIASGKLAFSVTVPSEWQWIDSVAFSRDGKWLAAGSYYGGSVQVCDAMTGREPRIIKTPRFGSVGGLAFSPDSKQLAAAGGGVIVWDVATWQQTARFKQPSGLFDVSFSPDGKRLAVCGRSDLAEWDLASGRQTLSGAPSNYRYALAYRPDGKQLAVGGGNVRVWDVASPPQAAAEDSNGAAAVQEKNRDPKDEQLQGTGQSAPAKAETPLGATPRAAGAGPTPKPVTRRSRVRLIDVDDTNQLAARRLPTSEQFANRWVVRIPNDGRKRLYANWGTNSLDELCAANPAGRLRTFEIEPDPDTNETFVQLRFVRNPNDPKWGSVVIETDGAIADMTVNPEIFSLLVGSIPNRTISVPNSPTVRSAQSPLTLYSTESTDGTSLAFCLWIDDARPPGGG